MNLPRFEASFERGWEQQVYETSETIKDLKCLAKHFSTLSEAHREWFYQLLERIEEDARLLFIALEDKDPVQSDVSSKALD